MENLGYLTSKLEALLESNNNSISNTSYWIGIIVSLITLISAVLLAYTAVKADTDEALRHARDQSIHLNIETLKETVVSQEQFKSHLREFDIYKNNLKQKVMKK